MRRSTEIILGEVNCAVDVYRGENGQMKMGKYRDHRERRGKRHGNEQGSFSEQVYEPSYFQDTPGLTPDAVDAEVIWFNAGKGFGLRQAVGRRRGLSAHSCRRGGWQ